MLPVLNLALFFLIYFSRGGQVRKLPTEDDQNSIKYQKLTIQKSNHLSPFASNIEVFYEEEIDWDADW